MFWPPQSQELTLFEHLLGILSDLFERLSTANIKTRNGGISFGKCLKYLCLSHTFVYDQIPKAGIPLGHLQAVVYCVYSANQLYTQNDVIESIKLKVPLGQCSFTGQKAWLYLSLVFLMCHPPADRNTIQAYFHCGQLIYD